jgi:predicted ribosome quality control (RQC) complex YloA/Tae2 family protein
VSFIVLKQEEPTKRLEFVAVRETKAEAEQTLKEIAGRTAASVPNAEVHLIIVEADYYYAYQGQVTRTTPPGYVT